MIKNEKEFEEAVETLYKLAFQEVLSEKEIKKIEYLISIIEEFEDKFHKID